MVDLDKMTEVCLKIRKAKAKLKMEYEAKVKELDDQLEKLNIAMMTVCDETGQKGFTTTNATVTIVERVRYWPSDWGAFSQWAIDTNTPEVFERRVSQKAIKQLIDEDPDIRIPTLNADRVRTVQVRKKA